MAVIVVSEQVLFDLGRFFTTLIKNQFFFKKGYFYGIWSRKSLPSRFQHFTADFDVFNRVSFLCCLTVLVVCEQVLNDLKRFDTNLVNKLFKNTFFLVLGHKNHF